MSTPRSLDLPPTAVPHLMPGAHGDLVVLDAAAEGTTDRWPVLMIPGFTGSKEDFLALLHPLAEQGHRVVAVDQRGQHESPDAADSALYDLPAFARDVLALVDGLGGHVHLVGHSFGGLVCRDAAITDPSGLASVTLLSSGPGEITMRAEETRLLLAAMREYDQTTVWEAMRERDRLAGIEPDPPAIAAFLRERWMGTDPENVRRIAEHLLAEPDRTVELAAAGLPLLVMHGADDDAWSPAEQTEMATRLGARHVVIPDVGHSPAVEDVPATVQALGEFFASVESVAR